MPRFDGSGPNGQGSMTGRGMGKCVSEENVREQNDVDRGRGFFCRRGRGMGFGRRNRFFTKDITDKNNAKD